jgi:hypothetical protein
MTREHVKEYISNIRNLNTRIYADHYSRNPHENPTKGELSEKEAKEIRTEIDELRRKK